jgi:hypothetical protein
MNPRLIAFAIAFGLAPALPAATYHVATTGNDTAPGSEAAPLRSVELTVRKAAPGDTILLHGGTYRVAETLQLTNSGSATTPIRLWAAPGEKVVLDFSTSTPAEEKVRAQARGVYLGGNWWHLKGLEICHAPDNGVKVEGCHNVIEQCVFHHNGDTGLQIGLFKKAKNDGSLASSNLVLNCDSFRNFDPGTKGENADGFACKLYPGPGNKFVGCRAWENADDGWDLYMTTFAVTIERCWAWHNGDATLFPAMSSYNGDGNGFKLGGQNEPASHLVRHCIAFDNPRGNGFEDNNNDAPIKLQNCTAWGNGTNFEFKKQPHVLQNCVAFDPARTRQDAKLEPMVVSEHNSWAPDPKKPAKFISTATAGDFLSLDVALAAAPRKPDGSLPENDFARPRPGGGLIDKGTNVGLPFQGAAPDLGAVESDPASH